jgi:multidrug/hemolysin transport system ATP-binding protein
VYSEENDHAYATIGGAVVCKLPSTLAALPILRAVEEYITGFEVTGGSMDDVFMEITGKALRE